MQPEAPVSGRLDLTDFSRSELADLASRFGEPAYRGEQLFQWLWQKGADDFSEMTNLSKSLRARLRDVAVINRPELKDLRVSADGTVKMLLALADGALVETVLIPEKNHVTQCLSSQVGCAMACAFCRTGQMGLTRNMTAGEIVGQVITAKRYLAEQGRGEELRNLVFMGMGEPLMNTREVLRALEILNHDKGPGFSQRRITVSTVGVGRGLEELGASGLASLAVSLHAPTQELREKIMPRAAAAMPLEGLMAALDRYPLRPRQRITYEYLLLRGVNDDPALARELARLLGDRKAKVNLIAFNEGPGIEYEAPEHESVLAFEKVLWDKNITATIRKSKGLDIKAACGQLKAERTDEQT
jgi:23S rRNA (adenine2503-C2)-methyltransferase